MSTNKLILLLALLLSLLSTPSKAQQPPKREFRGAWIHLIGQQQYKGMSVPEMKAYFTSLVSTLHQNRINALVFQVRPTADAFYYSSLEPWTKYLSGKQGVPPEEHFDPMQYLIGLCHERGMEFHAWLNPYRVTAGSRDTLHLSHIYFKHPEWFVSYGGQLYFDPGVPNCRQFICQVVKDIVHRYDLDAIHMDDYFYPYPKAGESFPDEGSFAIFGKNRGFTDEQRDDWRRNNVNLLIQEIKETIVLEKPWVRFGISPFGIYRNKRDTPDGSGSDTRGLQNYSDLYADVTLWAEKGWIDYTLPQLYWNIGFEVADYEVLINWWSKNKHGVHLYIGQDINRTSKAPAEEQQLKRKIQLSRTTAGIDGNCFWPGYLLFQNEFGIQDSLQSNYHQYPALIPAYTHLHNKTPKEVKKLKAEWTARGYVLHWEGIKELTSPEEAHYYVVYRFLQKEKVDLNNPAHIVCITTQNRYDLPYDTGKEKYRYVVTAVDRFHNESKKGKSKKLSL